MNLNPVLLLTAAVGLIGANSLALSPISVTVAQSFAGAAAEDAAQASAAYGIGTALSALTLAPLADKFGAARCLRWAMGLLGLAFLGTALAPTLAALFLGQALAGIAAGAALPAAYGLAADIAPKGEEARVLGKVIAGWTISMVFGVTLSAVLAQALHWRGVFVLLALIAAALILLMARTPFPGSRGGRAASPLAALRVPGAVRALFVVAALMVSFYGPYTYLGAHLTETLGRPVAMAALPVLAYGLGFGLAVKADPMIDRLGQARLAPWVFAAIAGVLLALAGAAASFPMIVAAAFAWGLANHLGLNLAVGRLNALDPAQRGALMGINSAVTYFAAAGAAVAFRPIAEGMGFAWAAGIAALIALTAAGEGLAGMRQATERSLARD